MARRAATRVALAGIASATSFICALSVGVRQARADSTLIIDGRGFGHGVGMAQDGAYWLGRSGRSASQILQTFYPGTTLSKRGGAIRVPLATAGSITMAFPAGGRVGNTVVPAGGSATVSIGGGAWSVASSGGPAVREASTQAPASGELLAAASATPMINATLRIFGIRAQGEPATTITVPVVAVPLPPPAPTPAPIPTPGPVPVANPVGELPTTAGVTTPAPVDPNSVPVVVAGSSNNGANVGDTATTTPQPVPVQAGDPAATGVTTSPENGTENDQTKDSKQTEQQLGVRIEATSKGLIGLAGRRYRGSMELQNRGGSIKVVNIVDVELYLLGMGEILSRDWPAATLQSQAIAARTYAIRMMGTAGEVCPTQACQVYLGAQVEYPQMNAAVAATRGKVVTYKGALANTFYSASGGGTIADPSEGFGGDVSVPYLKAGAYPTGDLKAWTVTMSLGEVARRVGYRGSPSSVAITKVGPSGRAKEVTVYGTAGALKVAGPQFDAALGLRSTFFTFRGSSIGMSPLPSDVGAASAVEVVAPLAPGDFSGSGSGGGFAPTAGQTGDTSGDPTGQPNAIDTVPTSSQFPADTTMTTTTVASVVLTTAPAVLTTLVPATAAGRSATESNNQVSVIDEENNTDTSSSNALKLLGGATVVLLGAGVFRRLRMSASSKRR
jgi:SpoIID/LytB domain protein